jgi:hypothetical protein
VSVYAFDPVRHEVVAVWPASVGALTHPVARLSPNVVEDQARELCGALSGLSSALWEVYIRPASTTMITDAARTSETASMRLPRRCVHRIFPTRRG